MAGSGNILGIAGSGLLAFQRALATTSHNIANANTPGYSRQRVDFSTQIPQTTGAGFIGNGVLTLDVRRNYDEFLSHEVRTAASSTLEFQTFHAQASRLADILGDSEAGLGVGIEEFFGAVNDLANDPASVPARQLLLSHGGSLADRFQYLDQQLSSTRDSVNAQLEGAVEDINTIAASIASANQAIVRAKGQAGGSPPNDLLDQRDALIEKLSEYVAVGTSEQDDGSVNVFIGNGQSLITGFNSSTLGVESNQFDVNQSEIVFTNNAGSVTVTQNIQGGSLGGLLSFRDQVLDPAQNALGRIAVSLSDNFNAQHQLGQDLDGEFGGLFFQDVTGSIALASTSNMGDTQIAVDVTDSSRLTTSDYRLDYDGANYTLRRMSDNVSFGPYATLPADLTASEGFTIDVASGTTINAGDSFLIQPARRSAAQMGLVVPAVNDIAAASPVVGQEAVNSSGVPTNAGSASIGDVRVTDTSSLPLGSPITMTFNGVFNTFTFSGGAAGSINYNPSTDSGTTYAVNGISFTLSGTPQSGDVFTLANNSSGVGDNRNMLALADLQSGQTLENGSASFQQAYAQLLGDVGTRSRQAELSASAQEGLLQIATEQRDAVSGVNLEEEAADLIRFQQAYEAVAQVISVAENMFQTLIGAFRR